MSMIFEKSFERSIDKLVARFSDPSMKDATVEAWLFDDQPNRKAAEAKLQALGVKAKLHSAYKPLVQFFLEDVDCNTLKQISIAYPAHEACAANRFLLETYPLTKLTGDAEIEFKPSGKQDFTYQVTLTDNNGTVTQHEVFAPNRTHQDAIGETLLSPTGWLKVTHQGETTSEHFETDLEQLFHAGIAAIANHAWGDTEPYFEELNIAVSLPIKDQKLAYAEESISLTEALHEDFYFALLEVFQKKSGRPLGDRGLQPGQIVPEITYADAAPSIRISARALSTQDSTGESQTLATAQAPLFAAQIAQELEHIGGEAFSAQSRSGRSVLGRYIKGTDEPMIISGGQHANETTGVVGALRAAHELKSRKGAHFTISPQENPDGYELHRRLCADNPKHMHHAARYTAMGDDLEYRCGEKPKGGLGEKAIRTQAEALTGAKLHVNLHGYPSHEWTRPLSGYIPRGFGMWTLPKGFFLIVRHHSEWAQQSEELVDHVTRHLSAIDGLVDYNNAQIALFEKHAGETGFRIINGFPCLIGIDDRHTVPLTLITEYPDETIYGEDFIRGHTAQMETVLSAYEALQKLSAKWLTV
ncbi:M14 family metallopeptidase [Pseudochrobactrum sp. sp1633]|uniref:M14 family metallopeptidase n=1 Tax=Pseudochrobactrum sp. sp1633 TaxID=3036706 RepID=UPI0025A500DD|nr:M14 family metallopeptidase [Pseudochrobactrum sp. sp1633]MDM8346069.1 M14 family metallopeptidase [Pseudochrobactrum sp. sp1633]HWD13889.1 M14 family metallopeptidase [Pseudochrobactrum sp.]